jgi:hypothetical protein
MDATKKFVVFAALLIIIGATGFYFSRLDGVLFAAMAAAGMVYGDTVRVTANWAEYARQTIPNTPYQYLLVGAAIAGVMVMAYFSREPEGFRLSLYTHLSGLVFLWLLFQIGYHANWVVQRFADSRQRKPLVYLEFWFQCEPNSKLPAEYWAALEPYIHSSPMQFLLLWEGTHRPVVGDTLSLPDNFDDWVVNKVSHSLDKGALVTRIELSLDSDEEDRLDLSTLLAFAEYGFQVGSQKVGDHTLTDILKSAGLPCTLAQYEMNNPTTT